ncbi:MAG: DUF2079 domain-containing protein [Candidatus Thermoplasmatota archaeon]|nr:DUF2079 domain-containing protein [Candidatus Thermoplasmatota archaeon]
MPDAKRAAIADCAVLLPAIALFIAIASYVGMMRYMNFYTSDWDLGIMQQMLFSTLHGRILFETADYSTTGYFTYLEVNSAYIAIPLAYIYGLSQTPLTLFLIQSAAVGLGAIPVYLISMSGRNSRQESILFSVLFLFAMATLSSIFYDYHWESFIPLEFLLFYYFVSAGRYGYSALVLVAGSLTIEVFPLLAAGVVLYFIAAGTEASGRGLPAVNTDFVLLLAACAVAFLSVEAARSLVIVPLFGVAYTHFYSTPAAYFVSPAFSAKTLSRSLIYWLLLLSTVAFLPLAKYRSLIMSAPWFVESVFLYPKFSQLFGYQYGFISFPPVLISAILGYPSIREKLSGTFILSLAIASVSSLLLLSGGTMYFLKPRHYFDALAVLVAVSAAVSVLFISGIPGRIGLLRTRSHAGILKIRKAGIILIVSLLFLNLVLGPLNTANFKANIGFNVSYSPNPDFRYIEQMAGMIPAGSYVFASDNLFPLVANNMHAYSAMWLPFNASYMPLLPFSPSRLPQYVFADSSQIGFLPPFIHEAVDNSSVYGLVAFVSVSGYPGSTYLWELHYTGNPTRLGQ